MHSIQREDIAFVHGSFDLKQLEGKKILITGATGLLGSSLVHTLLEWNKTASEPIKIVASVRNPEKAEKIFPDGKKYSLEYLIGDVAEIKAENTGIDYIIHGASPTSSRAFVETPVEIAKTSLYGTINLLELAKANNVKSFVFLSTMEVYGTPQTDDKIYEDRYPVQNVLNVRTCYPESKCMCENLCVSYASEYGVPAKILRLTQTFGPGIEYNDGRVFAEFARCVIEKRDIILKTKGETKRNYLYTADAVTAILTVLLGGENGNAYNAANEETYCSIYEMAQTAAALCEEKINVRIEENPNQNSGYAPTLKMNLSTEKLQALGWKPHYSMKQMYGRMIETMKKS